MASGTQQPVKTSDKPRVVILAAGGTGGHVLPAVALADELEKRGFTPVFMTDARGKKYIPQNRPQNYKVLEIASATIMPGIKGKLRMVKELLRGIGQSLMHFMVLRPVAVAGFGGYPSFPPVVAASLCRVPCVLHEQNAAFGKANRWLAKPARFIALSWPDMDILSAKERAKAHVTGNPVRGEICAIDGFPPTGEKLRVLVMGGSLGASVFSDVVPQALRMLSPEQRGHFDLTQQVRADQMGRVKTTYDDLGMHPRLEPFFDDVPQLLGQSHLVICRSGASTVAEIAAAGRPAVFVPYPHHADRQQSRNAAILAKSGAAWQVEEADFTPDRLADILQEILANPQLLEAMSKNAKNYAKPDAAKHLADLVVKDQFYAFHAA